jgi:hypothetical protein
MSMNDDNSPTTQQLLATLRQQTGTVTIRVGHGARFQLLYYQPITAKQLRESGGSYDATTLVGYDLDQLITTAIDDVVATRRAMITSYENE